MVVEALPKILGGRVGEKKIAKIDDRNERSINTLFFSYLAERVGFEPTVR